MNTRKAVCPVRMFRSPFPLLQPRVGASEPSLGSSFEESRGSIGWIIILLVYSVVAIWERSFLCQEHKAEDGFEGLRVIFAIECWCWVNLQALPVTFFLTAFFCSLSIFPSCSLSSLPLFPYLLLGGPSSPTVGWWNTSLFTFSSAIWRNYLSSRPGLGGGIHTSNTCSMFLNSTYFRNARITSLCLIFFPFLPIPPLLTALSLISSLSQFIQLI